MEHVRLLIIEGGSIFAIAGGFLSYVHGDTVVGNGGLLLGIAGIITAATPIIQGWIAALREERRLKQERLDIPAKMRDNEASILVLRDEVKSLHESVRFKRELIEQQQKVINILVTRVSLVEMQTNKAAMVASSELGRVDIMVEEIQKLKSISNVDQQQEEKKHSEFDNASGS